MIDLNIHHDGFRTSDWPRAFMARTKEGDITEILLLSEVTKYTTKRYTSYCQGHDKIQVRFTLSSCRNGEVVGVGS